MKLILGVASAIAAFLLAFAPAYAQDDAPMERNLEALTVNMTGEDRNPKDASAVFRQIWKDAFASILDKRKAIGEVTQRPILDTTTVFAVSFNSGGGRLILSATATPEADCQSYTNIGLAPTLVTCPMRVARVQNNVVHIIYEETNFPFSLSVNDDGTYNNDDINNRTIIKFDPK